MSRIRRWRATRTGTILGRDLVWKHDGVQGPQDIRLIFCISLVHASMLHSQYVSL